MELEGADRVSEEGGTRGAWKMAKSSDVQEGMCASFSSGFEREREERERIERTGQQRGPHDRKKGGGKGRE